MKTSIDPKVLAASRALLEQKRREIAQIREIDGHPISSALDKRVPILKAAKPKGPITADCYGAHTLNWSGGATPRRPHHE